MRVDIQAAISADGFMTAADGNTDWVRDLEIYEKLCREYGCIAMGRTTYGEYGGQAFEGVEQIVLTSHSEASSSDHIHFVPTVEAALAKAKELGFDKLLVIGGPQANAGFVRAGVVNKLMLDIHPVILGQGKKLFGDLDGQVRLRLESSTGQKDFVCLSYAVEPTGPVST